jgi:hypothetical protein
MNLGVALAFFVLRGTGGMKNGCINDSARRSDRPFFLKITVDDSEDRRCEPMLLQQAPEVHNRGVLGDRCAERQVYERALGRDFVQRFFLGWIARGEPVLIRTVNSKRHRCIEERCARFLHRD